MKESDHNSAAANHDHSHGGSVGSYILIALILGVITYVEFAIVEYEIAWLSQGATFFWLVALSVIKFILVIMFFMHLKYDDALFTGFFSSGMVIATGTLIALSLLFTVRSVSFEMTPQVEHGDEPELLAVVDLEHAAEVYGEVCSSCHGLDGFGIPSAMPPLAVHAPLLAQAEGGRDYMIDVLLYGLVGEIEVLGKTYNGIQPAHEDLDNEELADVLNLSVTAWGNEALLEEDFVPFSAEEIEERRDRELSPVEVYALREVLSLPDLNADLLRGRNLLVALDTPAPKKPWLQLGPDAVISEHRTPRGPDAEPVTVEYAPPPFIVELDGFAPHYEPGSDNEHGDGDPDNALEERIEAGEIDLEEARESETELIPDPEGEGLEPTEDVPLGPAGFPGEGEPETSDENADETPDAELDTEEPETALAGTREEADAEEVVPQGEAAGETEAEEQEAEVVGVEEAASEEAVVAEDADTGALEGETEEIGAETSQAETVTEETATTETGAEADVEADAETAVATLQDDEEAVTETSAAPWAELGSSTYGSNCASCHQEDGSGIAGAFPPLAGHLPTVYNVEGGREYIIHVLLYGLQGEIVVDGETYNAVMPPWPQLSNDQIAAVINHELTSWGNEAELTSFEPIEAREVAVLRNRELEPEDVYEIRQGLGLE